MSRKGQRNPSSSQGRLRRLRPLLEGALAVSLASQLPRSVASAAPPLSGRGLFVAVAIERQAEGSEFDYGRETVSRCLMQVCI